MSHALLRAAALVALAVTPVAVAAQTLDEGSFTITVNGGRVGREEFSIRGAGGARCPATVAQATITLADRKLTPVLCATDAGAPQEYQIDILGDPSVRQRLKGQILRGRMSVQTQSAAGESMKEYVVPGGVLVLDADIYHQYYFIARRRAEGSIPVIGPRRNAQGTIRVTSRGADRITIGGQTLDAERLVLDEAGAEQRELWVDAAGRVLKLSIPARGLVAQRDGPPA